MHSKLRWVNAQLHNHSTHSDGGGTPAQVVETLAARGAQCIALTDHNAVSGIPELYAACAERGLLAVGGTEVTTFYGHVVALGVHEYIDWRYYSPMDPESIFADIHARGGLAGVAHPIRIGYPLVPSCAWLFKAPDFSRFDYIELLNTGDSKHSRNDLVMDMWLGALRAGHLHLTATSGLDYHSCPWQGDEFVTWLGLADSAFNEAAALQAIKCGRVILCKNALIDISITDADGKRYEPGDHLPTGALTLHIAPDAEYPAEELTLTVEDQNGRHLLGTHRASLDVSFIDRFAVVCVYRGAPDFQNMIAVSNPFLR